MKATRSSLVIRTTRMNVSAKAWCAWLKQAWTGWLSNQPCPLCQTPIKIYMIKFANLAFRPSLSILLMNISTSPTWRWTIPIQKLIWLITWLHRDTSAFWACLRSMTSKARTVCKVSTRHINSTRRLRCTVTSSCINQTMRLAMHKSWIRLKHTWNPLIDQLPWLCTMMPWPFKRLIWWNHLVCGYQRILRLSDLTIMRCLTTWRQV